MSSRYTDGKRLHHHSRDETKERHRTYYDREHRSRSRSRSSSRSRSPPNHHHKVSSGSSSSSSYSRSIHSRERNGMPSANDKHKTRDADDLVCPPPPVISKVSMPFAKPQGQPKPVQLKLAAPKPVEPVKKITVASAFSNNDSDDDDDEEPPVKYSRNIGRDTPTSSGPNSFGKTKQGFCDVKKIFEKSLREYSND